MKDWQCGIELEDLLEHEKIWARYNEMCLSPFLEMKKHKIVEKHQKWRSCVGTKNHSAKEPKIFA